MFIRFVVHEIDPDSGRRLGLIQVLIELRDHGDLLSYEHDRVQGAVAWLNRNLKRPASFNRSSRPHALEKALSWFKDSAVEHIGMMREMAAMLEAHGVLVDVITTDRPGYITYEDDFQIVAEPFADTPT